MQVAYFKMHGTGNNIVVVDQRETNLAPPVAARLRELGDEENGPGFDQLMWVSRSENPQHMASYRVFNADGSEVEQCGNGVRCVARILAREDPQATRFSLASPAGSVAVRIDGDLVAVSMGCPEFHPARIPFLADEPSDSYMLDVDDEVFEIQAVSMGNPHCVLSVDSVQNAPVSRLGPRIEHHERFPEKANVGFMRIQDKENIALRVFERGVGETLACGTGACAAVVCGQRSGLLGEHVNVHLPGGQVMVSWAGGTDSVWLTGNAELISEGILHL
ncbi:MAG: diaminopimelate epimerase [Woeseiaceae bacterium]